MNILSGQMRASYDGLRATKMRNFWTMFGIIVGVASVITVVSIGQGIKQQISNQIHQYGKDIIIIRPTQLTSSGSSTSGSGGLLSGISVSTYLTDKDVQVVKATKGVAVSAPLSIVTGTPKGENGDYKGGLVIGTTSDLPSLLNQSLAFGFFISDEDNGTNVAIVGTKAADQMFNVNVPLGHTFSFRGKEFMTRGVFNAFNSTPLSASADFNKAIFIPYDVAQSMTNNTAPTFEILAKPSNPKDAAEVRRAIQRNLDAAHGGTSNIAVISSNQNLGSDTVVLDLLTKLIAGVAAISLLVGGIGIMNVMLVSVAERMHEIGIRKAIGATNRQILNQFLIEATLLSFIGGVIGVILALLIDVGLRLATDLQPVIGWPIVVIATGVSLAVGILFGTLPAVKAARKDPISALRAQ